MMIHCSFFLSLPSIQIQSNPPAIFTKGNYKIPHAMSIGNIMVENIISLVETIGCGLADFNKEYVRLVAI
jgi:hypothetical protein